MVSFRLERISIAAGSRNDALSVPDAARGRFPANHKLIQEVFMLKKILFLMCLSAFPLLIAGPGFTADVGIQFGSKWSSIGGRPTTVGLKVAEDTFSLATRAGLYRWDANTSGQDDNVSWVTLGVTYDHYLLPGEDLRPFVGADFDAYFYDNHDSELSFSLNPHLGAEYWLDKRFSVSGEAGLGFGFGDIGNVEDPIATTTAIHVTYYF
jgi:hypothetical protein